MGQVNPKRSGQHACADNPEQGRQIDIAQRIAGQIGGGKAIKHITKGAGHRNRKTDGSRCADSLMQRDIAPQHEWYRERTTTDPHQTGNTADDISHSEHAGGAQELPAGFGLSAGQHLNCHIIEKYHKKAFQKSC